MLHKSLIPGKCKASVHNTGATVTFHQCTFNAKKDGYCGRHHPDAEAKREQESAARYKAKMAKSPIVLLGRRIRQLEKENRRLRKLLKEANS